MSPIASPRPQPGDALIAIDVQRDFLQGGAMTVPRGDEVVPLLNDYAALFQSRGLAVFATRDWHPPDHCSFKEQGGPWPPHCVRDTPGAQFPPTLRLPDGVRVVSKATRPNREGYSPFEVEDFEARLRELGVRRLFIGGLATEYCVLAAVRDARQRGFEVFLLADAIRSIDAGDGRRAVEEMRRLGAVETSWEDVGGGNTER